METRAIVPRILPGVETGGPPEDGDDEARFELLVCGGCLGIYGWSGAGLEECACRREQARLALLAEAARCPYSDCTRLNERLAARGFGQWRRFLLLCRCCGASVIEVSSPFERWFCPVCLHRAEAINRACGFDAIRLGFNEVFGGAGAPARLAARQGAAAGGRRSSSGDGHPTSVPGEGVWGWGQRVVRAHLGAAGLVDGRDVRLEHYLASALRGLDNDRVAAELAAACGVPERHWPKPDPDLLRVVWQQVGSEQRYEAGDLVVWRLPGGADAYIRLRLTVGEASSRWWWSVRAGEAISGRPEPLASGQSDALGSARAACEEAALRVVLEQERRCARKRSAPARR